MLNSLGVLSLVRQLILWISLRCLARWTLPVAEGPGRYQCMSSLDSQVRCFQTCKGLVQRLSQIDFGEERGAFGNCYLIVKFTFDVALKNGA